MYSLLRCGVMLAAALVASAACAAEAPKQAPKQLSVCISDVPFPPFTNPDGSGYLQRLIKQAATSLAVELKVHIAPHRRCQEEVRKGFADATIGVITQDRASYAVFPMSDGKLDESKALVKVRIAVYRRAGTDLNWDGKRFIGLGDGSIGIQSGFAYTETLKQLGVRYDDSGKSVEQNLEKLILGRIAGMLMMDLETERKKLERHRGKIERIATPFNDQTVLFLFVGKPFYAKFAEFVETYWETIRRYRKSPEYLQYQ